MEGFRKHEKLRCHTDALQVMVVLPKTVPDVGEVLSSAHAKKNALNRAMLVRILRNMKFIGRHGLPLRGHDDSESNFIQLLRLHELSDPTVKAWMQRRVDKYCSPEIQNEMLKLISLELLRGIAHNLHSAEMFSIMADECTYVSNTEQLAICFLWVNRKLEVHKEFVGLFTIANISASTIVAALRDCLLRLNLKLSRCRGQCHNGASNMSGQVCVPHSPDFHVIRLEEVSCVGAPVSLLVTPSTITDFILGELMSIPVWILFSLSFCILGVKSHFLNFSHFGPKFDQYV